jgi:DNA-binding NtrC family response regulator
MDGRVLFVDDDPNILSGLKRSLHQAPYQILTALSGEAALACLADTEVDVVVTDQQMPGMPGTELLSLLREEYPRVVRIMMAGQATIGAAVHAVNDGAVFRFLLKPCGANEVDLAVRMGLAQKVLTDRSWSLLRYVRWESALIERLHAKHPQILADLIAQQGPVADESPQDDLPMALAQELDRLVRIQRDRSSPLE